MAKKIIIGVEQTFSLYDDDNDSITRIKCVKDTNHNDCRFCIFNKSTMCDNMICNGLVRPDGIHVHFEYIKL